MYLPGVFRSGHIPRFLHTVVYILDQPILYLPPLEPWNFQGLNGPTGLDVEWIDFTLQLTLSINFNITFLCITYYIHGY